MKWLNRSLIRVHHNWTFTLFRYRSTKANSLNQGIIDPNWNGNSATFFSYVCNGKKIKKLLESALNGIVSTVRCVSSTIVVLNAKLGWLLAAQETKKAIRNEEARQECRVLLVETHRRLTSIAILTVHAETSLLYTFQRSTQANRNINLW